MRGGGGISQVYRKDMHFQKGSNDIAVGKERDNFHFTRRCDHLSHKTKEILKHEPTSG